MNKPFPWYCPNCRQEKIYEDVIPHYNWHYTYEGKIHDIIIKNLRTPRCKSCNEIYFNSHANEQINTQTRKFLNILQPQDVTNIRINKKLSIEQFAKLINVSKKELEDIEKGSIIQNRNVDDKIRKSNA